MGTRVSLSHSTRYQYDRAVSLGPQLIRLRPAAHARTKVLSYSLQIHPQNHFINTVLDPYANSQARVVFPEPVREFRIEVGLTADLTVFNPFDFFLEPTCERLPYRLTPPLERDLAPYLVTDPPGPRLRTFLSSLPPLEGPTVDFLVALNQVVSREVQYTVRLEANVQNAEETLERRRGSCRDSAVLLVDLLRQFGFPARFVSGYLIQLKPDTTPRVGPAGAAEDFTDLHAWAEAYVPGAGWIGLDATSGLLAGEGHIPLAATPHPSGAAPVEGGLEPCQVDFSYHMEVRRLDESPRSTKPFVQTGRERLRELGRAIDQRLSAAGLELTIGGEPTFVADSDREAPEWNGEAMGPTKKPLALSLLDELLRRWAPHAVVHSSQGKWYPGESLPRWALSAYWRKDGTPLWNQPALRGDERAAGSLTHADALRFLRALVARLGVQERFIIEAFEDPLHFLTKEHHLPVNVEPGDPKLADPEERARLVEVFTRGLDQPTGFVLPLQKGSWKSGPWPVRGGRLTLIPGDSPLGLRLPLDRLPWAPSAEIARGEADPMQGEPWPTPNRRVGPFPRLVEDDGSLTAQPVQHQPVPEANPPLVVGESAAWVVRTALCVQVREGRLYVFLPPVREAEDWFALVAELEETAAETGLHPILEGYTPPPSPSYLSFQITPDPGVIEVNLPPAATSDEWDSLLTDLWESASRVGLSTLKFLVGGQETATGGGCHWVLGGPSPGRSPFLRRPDLLRSWVTYLNRHPSLSYVFSGLFVGATSQAPRFDETNPGGLEDLELAFTELDAAEVTPWLTDRIFRNLLVDGVGNTHRTEVCIDKLFSPGRASGRLGLVEFRSFEMAPHPDIAVATSQLLRALTLAFAEHPYREPLVRWGTALKDRWTLPAFLTADLREVMADLSAVGLEFPWEPFEAQVNFRFPLVGTLTYDGVHVEVRQALEPWPVMGEEAGSGGTVRYVDSSVERLEILVTSGDLSRYLLAAGGCQLPLTPLPDGRAVAGLRYKAWKLASGLHPTVPAPGRVVVDLIDRVSMAIVAGFTVWVGHPAGRHYELPPVNSFEAEARRQARFVAEGSPPGRVASLPVLAHSSDFPHTLSIHGPRQTPRDR